MYKRIFNPPSTHYFLFGPRGTGKSTWLKNYYPKAFYVDLLDPNTFRTLSASPETLEEIVESATSKTIIIDEIQKLPDLLDVVHRLIEKKQNNQYIMTGSSARKLKKAHTNLLAGRAILKRFHPFIFSEVEQDFELDKALKYGMLPLIWEHPEASATLASYIDLHLKEEILQEGLTRNVGNFSRFLEKISFSHGCVLNASNIARECQIPLKVITSYIEILEDLLLASLLPVFTKRAKRHITRHPKFYFFDTGVFRYLRPKGPVDAPSEINGQALEGLIYQHLKASVDLMPEKHNIFFWRTKNGLEVDFVLYGESVFFAIEVKHATTIHPKDLRGLKEFKKDYPEATLFFVYQGKQELMRDGIRCVPVDTFLSQLLTFSKIKKL